MKNFILGTDWWTDCDDAVALRLLTRAAKAGKIRLLGVAINACMEYSVASLQGFLRADGMKNVPVGIDLNSSDYGGKALYQPRLAAEFCPHGSNRDGEDAVRLYRRLLAEATEPVEILEIGFLQVIAAVLESNGDDLSPKTGEELFLEKVRKVWVMGGRWDVPDGKEHNFSRTPRASKAAHTFCRLCPVPVTFLGWEVGYRVLTGGLVQENDHLYHVLRDFGTPKGRDSWDPMLVQLALIGGEQAAGYHAVTGRAEVDAAMGINHFTPDPNGPHAYVIKAQPDSYYAAQINAVL